MLSASLFIHTLQKYSNYDIGVTNIKFIADKKALIDQQTEQQEYNIPYPNQTHIPEFDLTKQISLIHNHSKKKQASIMSKDIKLIIKNTLNYLLKHNLTSMFTQFQTKSINYQIFNLLFQYFHHAKKL